WCTSRWGWRCGAGEDYAGVWTVLSETLAEWGCWDPDQGTVTTGGLTQARQRLGHEPVRETFTQVAKPVTTEDTPGAFPRQWLKAGMDGLEWDIPDTEANVAAFGYPGAGKDGRPRFPRSGP
ncbi:MAG: transposase domain-containing protein, partial [Streptosporangiaceae bacterium]